MPDIVGFVLALLVLSIVMNVAGRIWFAFRWYVFGWRPNIFDEKTVNETVEECAISAAENDAKQAEEEHDHVMTTDELVQHRERVRNAMRVAIERYIFRFALAGVRPSGRVSGEAPAGSAKQGVAGKVKFDMDCAAPVAIECAHQFAAKAVDMFPSGNGPSAEDRVGLLTTDMANFCLYVIRAYTERTANPDSPVRPLPAIMKMFQC